MEWWSVPLLVGLALAYLLAIVLWIRAIAQTAELADWAKGVWVISVVIWPLIAVLFWYLLGPTPFGIGKRLSAEASTN